MEIIDPLCTWLLLPVMEPLQSWPHLITELLQNSFIEKIHGMFHKSYWGQLDDLNFTHCKGEGDTLFYIHRKTWKVSFQTFLLWRASMPSGTQGGDGVKSPWNIYKILWKGTEHSTGMHLLLFMDLGSSIRCPSICATLTKCDLNTFKSKLNYFLWQVPDQPCINWFQTILLRDSVAQIASLTGPKMPKLKEQFEVALHNGLSQ